MAKLLHEAKRHYDLVVLDTPPITVVPDAIPLIRSVGGVILVSRLGTSSRGPMHRLAGQLENLDAPVLGMIVNSADSGGEYAYGYSYGQRQPSRGAPAAATSRRSDPTPDRAAHPDDGSDAARRTESERPLDANPGPVPGEAAEGWTTPAGAEDSRAGPSGNGTASPRSPAGRGRRRDMRR